MGFRPSDNECGRYNVPVNALVSIAMRKTAELSRAVYKDEALAKLADSLADEIEAGIATYGTAPHPDKPGEKIYAYSTDGLGNTTLIDDANTPSLLSLEYFGWKGDEAVMKSTREFVLSDKNPWYHVGPCAKGVGSSHTPGQMIWPMALISQVRTPPCSCGWSIKLRHAFANDLLNACGLFLRRRLRARTRPRLAVPCR